MLHPSSTTNLCERQDSALLNGRGLLETIGVDTSEQVLPEVHVIEVVDDLIPVGLQVFRGKSIRCIVSHVVRLSVCLRKNSTVRS